MSLLLLSILTFLGVSVLFYILFGGADFGAGILEIFLLQKNEKRVEDQIKIISRAMAPVWEANHVWLILAIVILFMGFPKIYTSISIYLHLPLIAILLGIVSRGCAFTFRYYDTFETVYHKTYSVIFALSSLWTSFFLGILFGSIALGRINPGATDFYMLYINPWLNQFCIFFGLFVCALFAFLAAVYLMGETGDSELRHAFRKRAFTMAFVSVVLGFLVFVSAELENFPLAQSFFQNPVSIAAFGAATFLWIPFWKAVSDDRHVFKSRIIGATIVALVFSGWCAIQYPVAIRFFPGVSITFEEAAAPDATLRALLVALIVGAILIFPALAYLLKIFKWQVVER